MPTVNLGRIRPIYRGAYAAGTAYTPLDMVQYQGNMYQCIANSTGNLPTSTAHFVAVVDLSTWSSTLPSPGKIPLAEASGRLNEAWLQRKPDIKPSISVDWTLKPTAAALIAAGWTISRASEMTYFGQAPVKVAENLFTQSRTFGAAWDKASHPVTLTPVTHASGLQGFNLAATAVSSSHNVGTGLNDGAYLPSQTYRVRFLVKAGAYSKVQISDGWQGRAAARFDLAAGTAIASSGGTGYVSHSLTPHELGGGLYWCELVMTSAASGSWAPTIAGYPDTGATLTNFSVSYTGDGTSGIEVYAAQLQHNFDGDFVETTATPVTLYASPLLTAPVNELAYQHNANGECMGLLNYPAATNLCLQSQNLEHASWVKTGLTATSTKRLWAGSSPFCRLAKTTSATLARLEQAAVSTPAAGSAYSVTFALMGDYWSGSTSVDFGMNGVENGTWGADANSNFVILSGPGSISRISTGAFVRVTGLSYDVPTVVRLTRTYPLAESASRNLAIYPGTHTSTTVGAAILATRVQVESGPRATPYIPTTTAAVTRAAQTNELAGSAFAAANNPTQGTLLTRASVEDLVFGDVTRTASVVDFSAASGAMRSAIVVLTSGVPSGFTSVGNVPQAAPSVSGQAFGLAPLTTAYSYARNSFQAAAGGVLSTVDTAGELPPANRLIAANNWAGLIQRTDLYPRAMTAAELTAITTPGVLV